MAVRYSVQKSRPISKVKGQGRQRQKKNKKVAESSPLTVHSTVCHTQQAATDNTIAWPPRDDGLRQFENQRMLSSIVLKYFLCGVQILMKYLGS